jgi:hypothetical protein
MICLRETEMTIDPRQHLNGRWTEDIWSALKLFVESGLELLEPLKFAGRSLPSDEAEQRVELVSRLQAADQTAKDEERAIDARFCDVVRALNREWFLPRGVVVMRTMRRCERGNADMWDHHGVGIALVQVAASYFVEEGVYWDPPLSRRPAVSVYQVRYVFPNHLGLNGGQHDGAVAGSVLSLERLDEMAKTAGIILPQQAQAAQKKVLPYTRTSAVTAWREYGELMRRRLPSVGVLAKAMLTQTLARETRKAITFLRAERVPDEFPGTNLEKLRFFERMIERLLSERGSVRERLWPYQPWGEVVDEGGPSKPLPDDWRQKMDRANALARLSAELTAAAVGPEPLVSLSEWARELRVFAAETMASGQTGQADVEADFAAICGHGGLEGISAMTWAVSLLADELGWRGPDRGPPLRELAHGDVVRAAETAQRLVRECRREVRVVLKTLYAKQFNHAIDEAPFATIDSAGALHPRGA